MRIALTLDVRRTNDEDEAELDTMETAYALTELLLGLGHDVSVVDVACPIPKLVSRLGRAAPELVFNIAEGRRGRFREAFYPALFEQLGLAHTGSSASALAVCLDKALTKRVVAASGVRVADGFVVRDPASVPSLATRSIVKPNYEGSSKGITQASVVDDDRSLRDVVRERLARYPEGVLVEEYVDGLDVAVGFVEGAGVLPPVSFAYEPTGAHRILDLALKQAPSRVRTDVPAALDAEVRARVVSAAGRAFEALDIVGFGRADFRVTPEGEVVFLEMNPLPSLAAADEEMFLSAAHVGLGPGDVLARIVDAAR